MGHSTQSKASKIWDVQSSKLIVSRDVAFDESSVDSTIIQFPTNEVTDKNLAVQRVKRTVNVSGNIKLLLDSYKESASIENENNDEANEAAYNNIVVSGGKSTANMDSKIEQSSTSSEKTESIEKENSDNEFKYAQGSLAQPLGHSTRVRKQSGELWKTSKMLAPALIVKYAPRGPSEGRS